MRKKQANIYLPGDYNIVDDLTGAKIKASQARKRWDNIFTHESNWEERHPMDFLRVNKDRQKVPEARSDTTDVFESTPVSATDL